MSYSGEKLNKFSPGWSLDWPGEGRVVKISGVKSRIKQTLYRASLPPNTGCLTSFWTFSGSISLSLVVRLRDLLSFSSLL